MNHMAISLDVGNNKPLAWIYIQSTGDRPLRRPQSWADISRLAHEFGIEEKTIDWTVEALRWAEINWERSSNP